MTTDALTAERDRLLDEISGLRRQIDDLKAFEREYRTALKAHLGKLAAVLDAP